MVDGRHHVIRMAVEQITLGTVATPDHKTNGDTDLSERSSLEMTALVRTYLDAARTRDRFAFTHGGHARRRERFEQAAKTVAKSIATEASRGIVDRPARADVRTRLYMGSMILVRAVSMDQREVLERARRYLRWSVAFAIVGLLGIYGTLVGNGVLPQPW